VTATVLQLSDTHLRERAGDGGDGPDPDARLAAVIDAWGRTGEQADLIVLTGDLADDGAEAACVRLRDAVAAIGAPIVAVGGNHDVDAAVTRVFGPPSPVEVGAWRVVPVDSSRPDQGHGTVDVDAVLALLDGLDDRPTVLGVHHPPVSHSTHPYFQLDGAGALIEGLAARPHVRAVISGHLHDPFERVGPGDLALLGGPSTWVPLAHEGDRFEIGAGGPTGARVLRLADDGGFSSQILPA
jgi:Icc protein